MNVFGRNLVPPPNYADKALEINPKALPPPPIEETPVSIELSDNEAEDEAYYYLKICNRTFFIDNRGRRSF